jgi:hypothetical protein
MEGVSSVRIVGKPYRIFSTEYAVHYTRASIWMECVDRATVRGRTISQPRWGKNKGRRAERGPERSNCIADARPLHRAGRADAANDHLMR